MFPYGKGEEWQREKKEHPFSSACLYLASVCNKQHSILKCHFWQSNLICTVTDEVTCHISPWLLAPAKWIEWPFSLSMIVYKSILRNKNIGQNACKLLPQSTSSLTTMHALTGHTHTSHNHACAHRLHISPPCRWLQITWLKRRQYQKLEKCIWNALSQVDAGSPRGRIIIKAEGYFHKQNTEWISRLVYYKTVFLFLFFNSHLDKLGVQTIFRRFLRGKKWSQIIACLSYNT